MESYLRDDIHFLNFTPKKVITIHTNTQLVSFFKLTVYIQTSHKPLPPVAKAAVRSKAVVLLLLIYCFMYLPLLFVLVLCWSLVTYAILYVLSGFAPPPKKKQQQQNIPFSLVRRICTIVSESNILKYENKN